MLRKRTLKRRLFVERTTTFKSRPMRTMGRTNKWASVQNIMFDMLMLSTLAQVWANDGILAGVPDPAIVRFGRVFQWHWNTTKGGGIPIPVAHVLQMREQFDSMFRYRDTVSFVFVWSRLDNGEHQSVAGRFESCQEWRHTQMRRMAA